MKRILVIGNSGAGKSVLAKRLSICLNLPFYPSDPFYWEPGWKPAPADKVFQQVKEVTSCESWILDGNFDEYHEFVWKKADCIVWLDYPLSVILKQVVIRNFRWLLMREQVWSGNQMTLQRAMSGIRHAIRSYPMKKKSYPLWLAGLPGTSQYRFCTRNETETWLQRLSG